MKAKKTQIQKSHGLARNKNLSFTGDGIADEVQKALGASSKGFGISMWFWQQLGGIGVLGLQSWVWELFLKWNIFVSEPMRAFTWWCFLGLVAWWWNPDACDRFMSVPCHPPHHPPRYPPPKHVIPKTLP